MMGALMSRLVVLIMGLLLLGSLRAAPEETLIRGRLNDHAGVVVQQDHHAMSQMLMQHQFGSGNQVVALTLSSKGDESIETLAQRVWSEWRPHKGKARAVLLLLRVGDTGKGEMAIAAGETHRTSLSKPKREAIIAQRVTPKLQAGELSQALRGGVEGVLSALSAAP